MSKYLDRITASKDEKSASQAALAETQAKLSVEKFIADKKSDIAVVTAGYEAALGAVPFNVTKAVELQKELAGHTADLTAAQTILTEQF